MEGAKRKVEISLYRIDKGVSHTPIIPEYYVTGLGMALLWHGTVRYCAVRCGAVPYRRIRILLEQSNSSSSERVKHILCARVMPHINKNRFPHLINKFASTRVNQKNNR